MPKGIAGPGKRSGRPPAVGPLSLTRVRVAAIELMLAQDGYEKAICLAEASGNSIHQIALALGVSDERIYKIVRSYVWLKEEDGG